MTWVARSGAVDDEAGRNEGHYTLVRWSKKAETWLGARQVKVEKNDVGQKRAGEKRREMRGKEHKGKTR